MFETKWTMQDGSKIEISDLSESHLDATLKMVLRRSGLTRYTHIVVDKSCICRKRLQLLNIVNNMKLVHPSVICECEVRIGR